MFTGKRIAAAAVTSKKSEPGLPAINDGFKSIKCVIARTRTIKNTLLLLNLQLNTAAIEKNMYGECLTSHNGPGAIVSSLFRQKKDKINNPIGTINGAAARKAFFN
jgi:hypothetical protein